MAEYVLAEGDDLEKVVQGLLADADDPNDVVWSPRPNTPHGGVYVVPDALAEKAVAARKARETQAETAEDETSAEEADETAEDEADEAVVDDPNTPQDEHAEAQDRVAARRAARRAAAASEKSE